MILTLLPVHTSYPSNLPTGHLVLRGTPRQGSGSPEPDGVSEPGLQHDLVRSSPVQFGQQALVRGAALQGKAVPEGAEAFFLVTSEDAVAHRVGDALPEPLLKGAFNIFVGGAGAVGDGLEGLPERRPR